LHEHKAARTTRVGVNINVKVLNSHVKLHPTELLVIWAQVSTSHGRETLGCCMCTFNSDVALDVCAKVEFSCIIYAHKKVLSMHGVTGGISA